MVSSASTDIPPHAQILVVGGGPAGSYAAAALSREGFDVVLLEASKFPRYHVGESLIPSHKHYLRFIDAEQKVSSHGFARKPGAALKLNQHKREGYTDFTALGPDNAAWNVVRSEFDHILLEHASSVGVKVYENTKIVSLEFDENDKPISAAYVCRSSSDAGKAANGTITFKYLVDATGRAGLMSTKYLKNRTFMESLKNIAVWGYWTGAGLYGEGTTAAGAAWFEALTDESGWAWFIPLHAGLTSVGIVVNKEAYARRARSQSDKVEEDPIPERKTESTVFQTLGTYLGLSQQPQQPVKPSVSSSTQLYLETLELAPGLKKLLGDGKLVDHLGSNDDNRSPVHTASDFSYSADSYAGDGWRIIGDAAAFIDPFFSSGVHLAFTGGLSAAITISASIRGDCSENEAARWHTERVSTSFTRFLAVVLGAYKQITSQKDHVLSDVGEDNFDRAFKFLRPVIQGGSDIGHRLSEDELQQALDFCAKLFTPKILNDHRTAEVTEQLSSKVPRPTSDTRDTVPDPQSKSRNSAAGLGSNGWDAKAVLETRRVVRSEHGGVHNFEHEPLGQAGAGGGWVARLEKGRLGLVHVDTPAS